MSSLASAHPAHPKQVRACAIWRALEVVGDAPTMLIIEAFWLGDRRFDAFQKRTGLLKALVSDRLKRLIAHGIFEKRQYCARPPRFEYRLTPKGLDLYGVSLAMLRWERRWGRREGKVRIRLDHRCGAHDIAPVPGCIACGADFGIRDVTLEPGPGAGWMVPAYSRRRRRRAGDHGSITATTLLDSIVQITGDRWASLVLRSVFMGLRRFDEIQADAGMATNILAERLQWLVDIAMLSRRADAADAQRGAYRLTPRGIDYYPVLVMLLAWGDRWYGAPEGPPLQLGHLPGGHGLQPAMVCPGCRQPLRPQDTAFVLYKADAVLTGAA